MNEKDVYCDSMDIIISLLKRPNDMRMERDDKSGRWYHILEGEDQRIRFFHNTKKGVEVPEKVKNVLSSTYGMPDYIVTERSTGNVLTVIEDTKTASIGNSLLQRMDKMFPLFIDANRDYRLVYISPREKMDISQKCMRSVEQSWFWKSFLKHYPNNFVFLYGGVGKILPAVLDEIYFCHIRGEQKMPTVAHSRQALREAAQSVRTLRKDGGDYVFKGKIRKPSGSAAHPVVSTAMVIVKLLEHVSANQKLILEVDSDVKKWLFHPNKTSPKLKYIKQNCNVRVV